MTEARPLPITLDTVQLCIGNAERLLADSEKVSEPTALALAETAMEEALKGWVLYFHRVDRDRDAPAVEPRPELRRAITGSEGLWKELFESAMAADPRSMFESHGKKLEHLDRILEVLARIVGGLSEDEFAEMASASFEPVASLRGMSSETRKAALSEAREALSLIQKGQARGLRDWALRGLYVDLTGVDRVVDPQSQVLVRAEALRAVVRALLSFLKGWVRATAGA